MVRPLGWFHLPPIPPHHGFQGSTGILQESQAGIWEPHDPQSSPRVTQPPPGKQPETLLGKGEAPEAQGKLG